MTYQQVDGGYILRFNRNESLLDILVAFAKEKALKGAWIHGLGGSAAATLGYFNLATKQYEWKEFSDLHEVTALQGNLAWADGGPMWHLHVTLTNQAFQAVGGHVKALTVGATLELFVQTFENEVRRTLDDDTGLKLLAV